MKNIIKKTIALVLLLASVVNGFCQSSSTANNDFGKLILTPYLPPQSSNIPEEAKSMLLNKLNQVCTQAGAGGSSTNQAMIITANMVVLDKTPTSTAPPMIAYNMELTLYIGDAVRGIKFASQTVSIKGVGTNETKAYIDAFKNIHPSDEKIQAFVKDGKDKIIQYYNTQCDILMKDAQSLATQHKYEEAIARLSGVPSASTCYDKSYAALDPIYKKYAEQLCADKYLQAKANWNAKQNAEGAAQAIAVLKLIDPSGSCYGDALRLTDAIGARMKELGDKEWEYKMRESDNRAKVAESRNYAYRDIMTAYYSRPVMYNFHWW